jgi:hypothetical protein
VTPLFRELTDEEKLPEFQDENPIMSSEIASEGARSTQKMEVSTLRLFYEIR